MDEVIVLGSPAPTEDSSSEVVKVVLEHVEEHAEEIKEAVEEIEELQEEIEDSAERIENNQGVDYSILSDRISQCENKIEGLETAVFVLAEEEANEGDEEVAEEVIETIEEPPEDISPEPSHPWFRPRKVGYK